MHVEHTSFVFFLVPDAQLPMSEAVRVFVRNFEQR